MSEDQEMRYEQSLKENREAFIGRLMGAGWTQRDAEQEWLQVQGDDESGD